ncbi:MAG: hypothetical protein RLZZ440_829, partial [Planctomycetota bacterium]
MTPAAVTGDPAAMEDTPPDAPAAPTDPAADRIRPLESIERRVLGVL